MNYNLQGSTRCVSVKWCSQNYCNYLIADTRVGGLAGLFTVKPHEGVMQRNASHESFN